MNLHTKPVDTDPMDPDKMDTDPMDTGPEDTDLVGLHPLPLHRVVPYRVGFTAPIATEEAERYQCALELEKHIQRANKKFHLRLDHAAAIRLADLQQLKEGGRLWAAPPCHVPPYRMERRLNAIYPLCQHCKNTILTLAL